MKAEKEVVLHELIDVFHSSFKCKAVKDYRKPSSFLTILGLGATDQYLLHCLVDSVKNERYSQAHILKRELSQRFELTTGINMLWQDAVKKNE